MLKFKILSTEPTLRIVLQTSGFMPSDVPDSQSAGSSQSQSVEGQWVDTFNRASKPPAESKSALKLHLRRVSKPLIISFFINYLNMNYYYVIFL